MSNNRISHSNNNSNSVNETVQHESINVLSLTAKKRRQSCLHTSERGKFHFVAPGQQNWMIVRVPFGVRVRQVHSLIYCSLQKQVATYTFSYTAR